MFQSSSIQIQICTFPFLFVTYFFNPRLRTCLERKGYRDVERQTKTDRHWCEGERSICCLEHMPWPGIELQPGLPGNGTRNLLVYEGGSNQLKHQAWAFSFYLHAIFSHENLFKCNASVNVSPLRILRILSKWSIKKGRTKIMYFCKFGALLLFLRYIHLLELNRLKNKTKTLHEVFIMFHFTSL